MVKRRTTTAPKKYFTGIKKVCEKDMYEWVSNKNSNDDPKNSPSVDIEIETTLIQKHGFAPNMGLVIKDPEREAKGDPYGGDTVLVRTSRDNDRLWLINEEVELFGKIKPINKEQKILCNLLFDPKIVLQLVSGPAGSGKTLITSAYALSMLYDKKLFDKIILTKSMDVVGHRHKLGAMPGDVKEKFEPYLINFQTTFEQLYGERGMNYHHISEEHNLIRYLPIQLMRGASFQKALVIVDEAQNLDHHEVKTIGTRLGNGCKLIFLGDLTQIDRPKFSKEQSGLYHLMQSPVIKNSRLASSIELIKNVRSELSNLVEEAFTEDK